ncbi:hypothetical protein FVF58_04145 [Paraburkholderia panacisoli]|uniref:Uncharacterized protein n=1 Tax=Paraburkholderia panacisoli TaxID=2603818 RepID=A0A5B0HII9_9BURK|nr:hypothetical protein [Paraburkholderia panacisoli]KAA1015119.1 hypothetical protein FVF58_04145 [Paraburkholderia panacisoli]
MAKHFANCVQFSAEYQETAGEDVTVAMLTIVFNAGLYQYPGPPRLDFGDRFARRAGKHVNWMRERLPFLQRIEPFGVRRDAARLVSLAVLRRMVTTQPS